MTCLNAILNIHKCTVKQFEQKELSFLSNDSVLFKTLSFLRKEHLSYWKHWDLGINPFVPQNMVNECNWLQTKQFELLFLSTAASSDRLLLIDLLDLAGHFRYLWKQYDPKIYACILRLLNCQVSLTIY